MKAVFNESNAEHQTPNAKRATLPFHSRVKEFVDRFRVPRESF